MFVYGNTTHSLSENVFLKLIDFLESESDVQAVLIALALYSHYYIRNDASFQLPEEASLRLLLHPTLLSGSLALQRDQMAPYYWETIARTFIHAFPERSLQISATMLGNFGSEAAIFGGFHSRTHLILSEIAAKWPREVWRQTTDLLSFPIDTRTYQITQWLRGDFDWGEPDTTGALDLFPPDIVWAWVKQEEEKRPWFLATFVPKALFRDDHKICWARELLIRYGDRADVRENLVANFSTEGWMGNASEHYQQKKEKLIEFRQSEDNENVKTWIDEFVRILDNSIERMKVIEERED